MRLLKSLILGAVLSLPFSASHAEQDIAAGAGWFNFNRDTRQAINFDLEYRGNYVFYNLRPVLGGSANTDGGLLGYFGFDYDIQIDALPHWVLTPGLAIGAWSNGNSEDLGGWFEFHESAELDYKFDNNMRLGVQINHTSNAHLYDKNPGANNLMAMFSIPFGN